MMLLSTNNQTYRTSMRDAVLQGLAPDGGLFLPTEIPHLGEKKLQALRGATFPELAYQILATFFGEEVPSALLSEMCRESFNFPVPLVQLSPQVSVLELFHGPTCAFKDFGARLMSRLFKYFLGSTQSTLTVLTATSGDTGSAVANAFFDEQTDPPIRVVVLFPKGKVSPIQERQMTTLGKNIHALEVEGTFDDCQRIVKEALQSKEVTTRHPLTSANSINIARLLPQSLYYLHAWLSLPSGKHPIFSVPSGNLGNLTGGILAHRLGMPMTKCIAACNVNDVFPEYLTTGIFTPKVSKESCSNAMDVGNPSNFARLQALFGGDIDAMRSTVAGYRCNDEETIEEIRRVHRTCNYLIDPHTAVGMIALRNFLKKHALHPSTAPGIVLATAHPAKFSSAMITATGEEPPLPSQLQHLATLATKKQSVAPTLSALEDILNGISEV